MTRPVHTILRKRHLRGAIWLNLDDQISLLWRNEAIQQVHDRVQLACGFDVAGPVETAVRQIRGLLVQETESNKLS